MENLSTLHQVEGKRDNRFPIFSQLEAKEHEQVVLCLDSESGLRSIIAIHNTVLGPALGGVRMWPYENEAEAMRDVLRLSRGMTYKAAISGLNLGGGKAVIIGDPNSDKSESLFRAFGRYVDGLGGRYLTAEDVGMTVREMEWIHSETKYVTGIPKALGGSGNPSPVTAFGVYMGMKACAKKVYGNDSLEGKRIAIQGAGQVASHLADYLYKEGSELFITDIYEAKAQKLAANSGAEVVGPDDIYTLDVDIFSPCALGGVINDKTVDTLQVDIIAGGANNVLEDEEQHGAILHNRNILYAPDYVINAGGVMNLAGELEGYDSDRAHNRASRIYDKLLDIFAYSEKNNLQTHIAANTLAEERIRKIGQIDSIYSSSSHFSKRKGEVYLRNRG
jgi:leucine dehydrogenase